MYSADGGTEIDLRGYLRILRRRWWVVALTVVGCVGAALGVAWVQTPTYAASADLVIRSSSVAALPDSGTAHAVNLETEIQVLLSEPVRSLVREKVGQVPEASARVVSSTDVIQVRVEDADPELAAAAADAFVGSYVEYRRAQTVEELVNTSQVLEGRIAEERQGGELSPGRLRSIEELEALRGQLSLLAELTTVGSTLNPAVVPTEPFSPQPVRNGIVALVLGLVLGVGLAYLAEHFDDTIKTKDDLERAAGIPVVGLIPAVPAAKGRKDPDVVSVGQPNSSAAEAYRTLRTSVQFIGFDKPVRVIQVTSPSAMEGKTTIIANLGVALARAGRQATMICCDLRRPRLHKFFGFNNRVGFTSLLLRDVSLADALQSVPDFPRLSVLASGPVPPNPSEQLASQRATDVLAALKEDDERVVLIDSPPVLPVTDSLVISRWADATLLVCSAGETRRGEVHRAVEMLQRVGAPIVGTVLNGVKREGRYGYDYKYHYRPYALDEVEEMVSNGHEGNGYRVGRERGRRRRRRRASAR